MRVLLLFLFSFILSYSSAQDTIIKRTNDTLFCKVLEITPSEIKYRNSTTDDVLRSIEKSSVVAVHYSNGTHDEFSATPVPVVIRQVPENAPETLPEPTKYIGQRTWKKNGKYYNEDEFHTLLTESHDPAVMKSVGKAEFARKTQYIGWANIPVGIAGIAFFAASVNTYNTSSSSVNNSGNLEVASAVCALLAVNLNIYGAIMFHAHHLENNRAMKQYNLIE